MKKKFLLCICSFLFVLQIDASWRDQWVWFKSLFSGFSIKKPIITRKKVVIGGVGALAVAGAAWWWFKRVSKKSPPQKNESPKKEEPIESKSTSLDIDLPVKNQEQLYDISTKTEISYPETSIVIQGVDTDNPQVNNPLLKKEEVIPEDLTENIKSDINTAQKFQNADSTISTQSIQEKEQQKVKQTEEKEKIVQKYQLMNQAVDTKKAIGNFQKLIDGYEKQKELTDFEISELKKEFQKLDSTIPKGEMPFWKSIKGRYNELISTKK